MYSCKALKLGIERDTDIDKTETRRKKLVHVGGSRYRVLFIGSVASTSVPTQKINSKMAPSGLFKKPGFPTPLPR